MKKLSRFVALMFSAAIILGLVSCKGTVVTEYVDKTYAKAVTFTSVANADESITVTLASATEEAEIFYTTDGSVPTAESTKYASPLTFTENAKISAIAIKSGIENSPVSYAVVSITEKTVIQYVDKVYSKPVIFTTSTKADGSVAVTMTTETEGAEIYYTTDGTEPDSNSTKYTSVLTIATETTYKAIAIKEGIQSSPVCVAKIFAAKLDTTAPANVTSLTATNLGGAVTLAWADPIDVDLFGIEISWTPHTSSRAIAPMEENTILIAPGTQYAEITKLVNGTEYTFTVKAVDTNGNKSEGVNICIIPVQQECKLSINIALPNDDGENIILTNDIAPINVEFSSIDSIVKAVWKKGEKNIGVKPEKLLADNEANVLILDSDFTSSFTVSENGWYDVVAKDSAGRYEWEQIEIKTIDTIPLAEVKDVTAVYADGNIDLTWHEPKNKGNYDSSLNSIKISYIYNDDETDLDNGTITIDADNKKSSIQIADEKKGSYLQILLQTIDEVGNVSAGRKIQAYCSDTLYASTENVEEKISSMTFSGKIVVTGKYNYDLFDNIRNALLSNTTIKVELDLSEITDITEIDYGAFYGCSNLVNIILPDSVTTISENAFYGCSNLINISLPDSVTEIWGYAFCNCSNLTSINLPDGLEYIGRCAFYGCSSFTSIIIPSEVYIISEYSGSYYSDFAFGNCNNLKDIYYKGTIEQWCSKSWPACCFGRNYNLYIDNQKITDLIIPNNVTEISEYSFYNCSSLKTVNMPNTITQIGKSVFCNCSNLTSIEISDSVESIPEESFRNCTALETINIPDSVNNIGQSAFYCCSNLRNISIPNGVETINNSTFYGCSNLINIYIPNTVKSIEARAFYKCYYLKDIVFPDSVKYIGYGAFYECRGLTSITIPDGVTIISSESFYDCYNLKTITIPSTVTRIGIHAFYCVNSSILFADTESNWYRTENNYIGGELLGPMSATDIEENGDKIMGSNNSFYYYYNEKYANN